MSNNTDSSLSVIKCRNGLPNESLEEVIAYTYDVVVTDENVDLESVLKNIQSTIINEVADAFGCYEGNDALRINGTHALNIPDVLSFDSHPSDIADDRRDCVAEGATSGTDGICFPIQGFITATICQRCPSVEMDVLRSIKGVMETGPLITDSDDLSGILFLGKMLDEMPHIPAEPVDAGDKSNTSASSYYESHDVTALGGVFVATLCSSFLLFWVSIARRRRRQLTEEEQDENFSDFEGEFETEMDEYK